MITKAIQLELFDSLPKIAGHVTWVKVPAFMVAWMYTRFGFPCVLPTYNQLARVMRGGLTRNMNGNRLHECSMTDVMMRNNSLKISEEDKLCFVPVALPNFPKDSNGTTMRLSNEWQINAVKTIEFRKEVRYQFFYDLNCYIHDTLYRARLHKKHITFTRQLGDWMTSRGIDDDFYETIERQYRKDMKNARREIEHMLKTTDFRLRETEKNIIDALRKRQQSGRVRFKEMQKKMQKMNERMKE